MPTVPKTRSDRLEFYETHIVAWQADPGSIGLDAGATDAQADRIAEARAAYDAHQEAIAAARAATQRYYNAVEAMHADPGAGADMIETIKAFAETTDDVGVYARAQIPPPATKSTAPPPGTPTTFGTRLLGDGALRLTWKCNNPRGTAGTVYEVLRSVGEGPVGTVGGEMEYLGTAGSKSFTDTTIPAGATNLVYQITALRSTRRGSPARFTVRFGGGAGAGGANVGGAGSQRPPRIAA